MSDRPRVPSYRRHKQSGQAIVTLTDALTGRRRDVLLGPHNTKASREEYKRVVLEWEANERRLPGASTASDLTVAELIRQYWRHVEEYYRHEDGTPTGEVQAMRYALRPLNHLHGQAEAGRFGPSALKAVRELMVRGYEHPKYGAQPPICRTRINAQVKRVRRMFKWAVENELVAAEVHQALCAVAPLKRGRTEARGSAPVLPVARAVVEDTLPVLRPILADMVRQQLETGMRPRELVVMRACDIDMTGAVWLYRPASHKTAHHGHERIVVIGPKGQEIIRRHLTTDTQAYLFSPRTLMEQRSAELRANRKTKVQPSQRNRKKRVTKKRPGDRYIVTSYAQAIRKAIERANRGRPEGERLPHWHPHQLRHLRALELKREAGLDVARAVLGHRCPSSPSTTPPWTWRGPRKRWGGSGRMQASGRRA
ncbi:MAG TPA: site-specific integrase [Gemmataceae bacterium]|nr:site-specific integrase [Gemmataceae bacterium]